MPRERTLERRLFSWTLFLTLIPALAILVIGGWLLATSLDMTGALGPWESVAASGLEVVERAEPVADSALAAALAEHRAALSGSLTQARRWSFLGQRFLGALPWLVLLVGAALAWVTYIVIGHVSRQLARPIKQLAVAAERLGRREPLPPPLGRTVREVRVLDRALRSAAAELERSRERELSAERMRVWGEMARRVAHEMKNPLTPLRLASHRLARSGDDAGALEVAEVIAQEVSRLEELAGQFGALGRPPEGPPTDVDLPEMLASLLETDVPPGVEAELSAEPDLPPVRAHYDTLLRAFRNLVRNGVEAMDGSPRKALRVAVARAAEPSWLDVRISDTGSGLPPGSAERIFDPDFTTKTRGTGLGLALVRQAVEADGGTVSAESGEDGAVFTVRLPAAEPSQN